MRWVLVRAVCAGKVKFSSQTVRVGVRRVWVHACMGVSCYFALCARVR